MKNSKKILAALAALTVMTTVAGTNVFAAEKETEETHLLSNTTQLALL